MNSRPNRKQVRVESVDLRAHLNHTLKVDSGMSKRPAGVEYTLWCDDCTEPISDTVVFEEE